MSWKKMLVVAVAVGLAAPLSAQQGPRGGPGGGMMQGPREGHGIGQLLELRETLELSDEQVTRLESLQASFQEQREARRASMAALRTEVRSGDLSRNEIQERMQAHREAGQQIREAHQAMVQELLTPEQQVKLDELRALHRRGVREGARAGFRAGQRMHDRPGAGRGMRGRDGVRRPGGIRGLRSGRQDLLRPGFGRRGPGGGR